MGILDRFRRNKPSIQDAATSQASGSMSNGPNTSEQGSATVYRMPEEADAGISQAIHDDLRKLIASRQHRTIIVDFGDTHYIDSACLRILVEAQNEFARIGGMLALARVSRNLLRVFEITRLDKAFPIFDSIEMAAGAKSHVPDSATGDMIEAAAIANLTHAFDLGESTRPKELKEAARLYASAVQADGKCYCGWFNLGIVQSRLGLWNDAISSLSRAETSPDYAIAAAFAKVKLLLKNGREVIDADLPPSFRGTNRSALGVQGPCHNAANVMRNMGFMCIVEGDGEHCSIKCNGQIDGATVSYRIDVDDVLGQLLKAVYRESNGETIYLGDLENPTDLDRQVRSIDVGRLELAQAPIPGRTMYWRRWSAEDSAEAQ